MSNPIGHLAAVIALAGRHRPGYSPAPSGWSQSALGLPRLPRRGRPHGVLDDPRPERDPLRLATLATGLLVLSAPGGAQPAWLVAVAAALIAMAMGFAPHPTPAHP